MEDDHAYPTEAVLTPSFMSYEPAVIGKCLLKRNCVLLQLLMIAFKNGCGQEFFSSCGKQDRSNLKSFKGSIGTGTRVKEPERSSRGGGETPAKAQPVVERVGENAVGSRPGMRCQPRWRLKKPGAMGCARVQSTPDAIVMELTFPIHALATALHESRLKRGLR